MLEPKLHRGPYICISLSSNVAPPYSPYLTSREGWPQFWALGWVLVRMVAKGGVGPSAGKNLSEYCPVFSSRRHFFTLTASLGSSMFFCFVKIVPLILLPNISIITLIAIIGTVG